MIGGNAPAPVPPVVLFDFDGVLHRGDAFRLFVRQRYRASWWRTPLVVLLAPLLGLLCLTGWRQPVRLLVAIGLAGLDEAGYRRTAEAFAAAHARLPGQFLRAGLATLRRHQQAGARVLVVTGCEQILAQGILRELGLGDIEVLASSLVRGGFGLRIGRHNIGRLKAAALATHGIAAAQRAYGDSMLDAAMLKLAAEPVLVNPVPKLVKRMERALGRTVERVAWA